jgi:leucyl/phenylalanyl-tRNA--protein transferase
MSIKSKLLNAFLPGATKDLVKRNLQSILFNSLCKVSGNKENALMWANSQFGISPYLLYSGFAQGFLVLPNMRNHQIIDCIDPEIRGVMPIEDFKIQDGLHKLLKKEQEREIKEFEVKIDQNFEETIIACSKPRDKKAITWLSDDYIKAAVALHKLGIAHSIETYQNGLLVGGVVGIAINSYFLSLTLFHTVDNASKVAFYHLMEKLKAEGFKLHDLGVPNPWIQQFGMKSIRRQEFKNALLEAIATPIVFNNKVPIGIYS